MRSLLRVEARARLLAACSALICMALLPGRLAGQTDWQSPNGSTIYVLAGVNVGIGYNNPGPAWAGEMLGVMNTAAGVRTTALNLINSSGNAGTAVSLDFSPNVNIPLARINANRTNLNGYYAGDTDLEFWNYGSGLHQQMVIKSNGNVGIGTTTPAGALQIGNNGAQWGSWNYGTNLIIKDGTTPRHPTIGIFDVYGNNAVGITNSFGDLSFSSMPSLQNSTTAPNARLVLTAGGNVGIGTTAPGYKLAVNGTIGTKEVVVTNTGWADYVLRPGYSLKPLSHVEAFIRENHRLPDMPSAQEVQENGVPLGDMQVKLLAKIEELTLHMIQEHERSDRLERQNRELQARIAKLESISVTSGVK